MNLNTGTSWVSAAGLGALLLAGPALPLADAQITVQFGRGQNRLEGQRYDTMRRLAHYLDQAAQTAARAAADTAQERNGVNRQRFLWAINDFARQTRSFHERLDQYGNSPWYVADEVAALDQRARQVSSQIRGANAFRETYADWGEAVNALNLMHRSLAGQDVRVPSPERRAYQPFDDDYRDRDGRPGEDVDSADRNGYVTGSALRQFRRLANDLNAEVERAVSAAQDGPDPSDRGNRSLNDLRAFAQGTSDLSQSSGADSLNSREVGSIVSQLMSDARRNDRSARARNEDPLVEWASSVRQLEQMAALVRYQ